MSIGARQFLALFLVLGATAACTVEVDQRPVPSRPQACTFEHAPVCAQRGGQQRTFSNACLARSSGFRVLHRGQCRPGGGPVAGGPVACTREFAPVCARRGNRERTFDNPCLARSAGFQILHRGQCRSSTGPIAGRPGACTREFAPVCARRGNFSLTFDNACLARADGFRPIHSGRCR
ncbi:Kazal-type serine protease inhibitor domain-containing protein [Mesorhizobium sp. 1B3]|uniref:Kazal-type serine protease inhibitor domain-containing protein n=1 Tax=Mesorhizobium sp. 1B3 TaxID=3243599 RepID=UPI003D98AF30